MKKVLVTGLVLAVSSFSSLSATAAEKVFDGGAIICSEAADIGNPGVLIQKKGQQAQEDGIYMTFSVTSKVCVSHQGQLAVRDSRPLQKLVNGALLADHEVVFTTDSSSGSVQVLGSAALEMDKATTEIGILIPKNLQHKNIDSFLRVKLVDSLGPVQATFGAFRHSVK